MTHSPDKKVLELFAGSRSIGKEAEKMGMEVFSSDIEQFGGIDYVTDILSFDYRKVPFIPDMIWASPPCTGFSVASIGTHWGGGYRGYEPQTDTARLGIALVKKTVAIIAAPRGSKTGTQGRSGAYDRSRIPAGLCREILESL